MANEYTLGGPPPQSRSEKILMKQNQGPAQSRIEELLKNASGRTSGALIYKGTVETAMSLPASGNEVGDVYHVNSDGSEWGWNGEQWEELGKSSSVLYTEQFLTPAQQEQVRENIGAGTYSKPSGGIPTSDFAPDVKSVLSTAVKKISLSDLPNVGSGTYTLGVVDVTAPIQFPRIQNRGVIIVDTVFNIKTPVLFPPYRDDSFFTLPCFIGCTFNNSLGSRVLISSGATNIVGGRVTGCNFFNVDYAASPYLQDFNFVNCYIQSYQTFLDNPASTVQARFVNCDAEAECKTIVNAKNAYIYASGTYEGNGARNEYHFNVSSGVLNFTNCWLENEKLLSLTGGASVTEKTIINMVGCNVQINATPMVVVANPQYVNLFIDGSVLVPQNSSAIFIDKTAAQMMSVTGDFVRASADAGYVKPIGGVVAEDRKVATIADVPISGFHVPQGSITPTLSFKTSRHFGGLFIGYNMCAYVYGTSNGSASGVGGHWGGGDQPTITYDSETGKYTITGKKYQAFTFIPSVDARLYFTDVEIVTD